MDQPAQPFANPSRLQPMAPSNALTPASKGKGIQVTVAFQNGGTIGIPVLSNGVQTFDGSPVVSQSGGSAGDSSSDPVLWDVQLQPVNTPSVATASASRIYWQMRWWVQGAEFESPIVLLDESFSAVPAYPAQKSNGRVVAASAVEVLLYGTATSAANATAATRAVGVALTPFAGGSLGPERYNWQWNYPMGISGDFTGGVANLLDATASNKFLQGGCMGQFSFTLNSTSTSVPLYPMLLDLADKSSVVSGTTPPIQGSVLGSVTNAADWSAVGDEFRPGSVRWQNGLCVGLSSTRNVFTYPGVQVFGSAMVKVGT